ncbi:radical SAM protein [Zhenpiania hominis]|uniref:radical SAM protein n=1 Tax=Zhenpiania hominis TaxID=2763644 RepID=UPI0039F55A0E
MSNIGACKRIAIFFYNEKVKRLVELLRNTYEVEYIAEDNHFLWGKKPNQLTVVSIAKVFQLYINKKIDKVVIPWKNSMIQGQNLYCYLLKYGFEESDVLYAPYRSIFDKNLSDKDRINLINIYNMKDELECLDIIISNSCDIKCKNCSLFTGLAGDNNFADFEISKVALRKIKSIYSRIDEIHITGGEPFLNPDLSKYCRIIREFFPKTKIFIDTNGVVLKTLQMDDCSFLLQYDIVLKVAYFPEYDGAIDKLHIKLDRWGIRHQIRHEKYYFEKYYDFAGKRDINDAFFHCKKRFRKLVLYENELFPCYTPFALRNAERLIPLQISDKSTMDLFEKQNVSNKDVWQSLNKSSEYCRFCYDSLVSWKNLKDEEKRDKKNWSV